jgi:hypothetical protein
MSKKEGFLFFCFNYLLFVFKLFESKFILFSTTIRMAIKNEDIYIGAVYVNLDGTKSWLDLILKMIKMKVDDCYIIKGVRKILVNGIEIKESNDIPSANLDSIIAVCVLDELGVRFLFKCVI